MFLERGFVFTHEAVRDWEARFAPLFAEHLRARRRGQAGTSWYVDETYVKVQGKWCYLYRAIDRDGNLVDSRLSQKRDRDAAKQFFSQALEMVDSAPERVTTDGHDSYPRAIRETIGHDVMHRTNAYLNNRLEQDHRGIKQRYYPMRGFGSFTSGMGFFSFETAWRTVQGFEVMNMIRKGQLQGVAKGDVREQVTLIAKLFGVAG